MQKDNNLAIIIILLVIVISLSGFSMMGLGSYRMWGMMYSYNPIYQVLGLLTSLVFLLILILIAVYLIKMIQNKGGKR